MTRIFHQVSAAMRTLQELQQSSDPNVTDKINRVYMDLYKLTGLAKVGLLGSGVRSKGAQGQIP